MNHNEIAEQLLSKYHIEYLCPTAGHYRITSDTAEDFITWYPRSNRLVDSSGKRLKDVDGNLIEFGSRKETVKFILDWLGEKNEI